MYVEPQLKLASVVCCMYTGWLLNTVCCVMSQLLHVSLPARGSTLAWAMLAVWMELKFHSQSSKSTLRCRCVHGEALITSKTLQWHPPPHRLPLPQWPCRVQHRTYSQHNTARRSGECRPASCGGGGGGECMCEECLCVHVHTHLS